MSQDDKPPPSSLAEILARLSTSSFRAGFHLSGPMQDYACQKGLGTLEEHAEKFITERLATAAPANDGKQTPMKGHPVFLAQHACACCCRGCLDKWHAIPKGRPLTEEEKSFVVRLLLAWITRQTGPKLGVAPATSPPKPSARAKAQPPKQLGLF